MEALATVTYAGTKKNLVESEMVADTPAVAAPQKDGDPWKVKVVLTFPRDTDPFLKSTLPVPRSDRCSQVLRISLPSALVRVASARALSLPTSPSHWHA